MLLKILSRILFVNFLAFFAVQAYRIAYRDEISAGVEGSNAELMFMAVTIIFGLLVVFFEWRFQKSLAREVVAIAMGLAGGLIVSAFLIIIAFAFVLPIKSSVTDAFWVLSPWIPVILVACCYVAITLVMQTKSDFRFLIPYIDFSSRGTQEGGLILDTSAIIDGRIADVVETRIISVPLIIPDFVIREMQLLADSSDKMKRLRGRRGLDMVARLQKTESARIVIRETDTEKNVQVDNELVKVAKEINGRIITTDFNLNKVSQIEGLTVINLNDLANAVKPAVLPGEKLNIKIIRAGQEAGQGVGYLDDGTMVVIEGGRENVGEVIEIVVTGSIQTSAGRMIFGRTKKHIEENEEK